MATELQLRAGSAVKNIRSDLLSVANLVALVRSISMIIL